MNAHTALARALMLQKKMTESAIEIRSAEKLLQPGATDVDIGKTLTVTWCRYGMAAQVQNQVFEAFEAGLKITKAFAAAGEPAAACYLLEQLKNSGFFVQPPNRAQLDEKAFDSIRNRTDFKKLIADIDAKNAVKK